LTGEPVDDVSVQLVVVIIPVRNEAERIGACLDALASAIAAAVGGRLRLTDPRVRTVVVLDRCTDASAGIVATYPWVETVVSSAGRVGAARAIGVQHALSQETVAPERIWIATTDADSRVPADWLSHQLAHAASGADLFRGLVEPDPEECGPSAYEAWFKGYVAADGHGHVHGANLGVRGDAYAVCGGFDQLAAFDEDVTLSRNAQHQRLRVVASAQARVATSGRLRGRVEGAGFAAYLRDRAGELRTGAGSDTKHLNARRGPAGCTMD
jgi:glycosyltransferase involved in cell wall biosynthesis